MQGRRDRQEAGTKYKGLGRPEGGPAARKWARNTQILHMILSFHIVSLGARGGAVG